MVLGSRVHLHGLLKLWNRLRSVVGQEDMMAMAVVPCRLFSRTRELVCLESGSCAGCVFNQFLIWLHVLLSSLSGSACYCGAGLWFLRWCWSWTVSSSSSSVSRWYCRYVSPSTRHAAFDSISRLLVSSSKACLAGSLGFQLASFSTRINGSKSCFFRIFFFQKSEAAAERPPDCDFGSKRNS